VRLGKGREGLGLKMGGLGWKGERTVRELQGIIIIIKRGNVSNDC
jgi:hypothetical protein